MKKQKMRVYISDWNSKFFPLVARFTMNATKYSLVFETEQQIKNYFDCRYISKQIEYIKR